MFFFTQREPTQIHLDKSAPMQVGCVRFSLHSQLQTVSSYLDERATLSRTYDQSYQLACYRRLTLVQLPPGLDLESIPPLDLFKVSADLALASIQLYAKQRRGFIHSLQFSNQANRWLAQTREYSRLRLVLFICVRFLNKPEKDTSQATVNELAQLVGLWRQNLNQQLWLPPSQILKKVTVCRKQIAENLLSIAQSVERRWKLSKRVQLTQQYLIAEADAVLQSWKSQLSQLYARYASCRARIIDQILGQYNYTGIILFRIMPGLTQKEADRIFLHYNARIAQSFEVREGLIALVAASVCRLAKKDRPASQLKYLLQRLEQFGIDELSAVQLLEAVHFRKKVSLRQYFAEIQQLGKQHGLAKRLCERHYTQQLLAKVVKICLDYRLVSQRKDKFSYGLLEKLQVEAREILNQQANLNLLISLEDSSPPAKPEPRKAILQTKQKLQSQTGQLVGVLSWPLTVLMRMMQHVRSKLQLVNRKFKQSQDTPLSAQQLKMIKENLQSSNGLVIKVSLGELDLNEWEDMEDEEEGEAKEDKGQPGKQPKENADQNEDWQSMGSKESEGSEQFSQEEECSEDSGDCSGDGQDQGSNDCSDPDDDQGYMSQNSGDDGDNGVSKAVRDLAAVLKDRTGQAYRQYHSALALCEQLSLDMTNEQLWQRLHLAVMQLQEKGIGKLLLRSAGAVFVYEYQRQFGVDFEDNQLNLSRGTESQNSCEQYSQSEQQSMEEDEEEQEQEISELEKPLQPLGSERATKPCSEYLHLLTAEGFELVIFGLGLPLDTQSYKTARILARSRLQGHSFVSSLIRILQRLSHSEQTGVPILHEGSYFQKQGSTVVWHNFRQNFILRSTELLAESCSFWHEWEGPCYKLASLESCFAEQKPERNIFKFNKFLLELLYLKDDEYKQKLRLEEHKPWDYLREEEFKEFVKLHYNSLYFEEPSIITHRFRRQLVGIVAAILQEEALKLVKDLEGLLAQPQGSRKVAVLLQEKGVVFDELISCLKSRINNQEVDQSVSNHSSKSLKKQEENILTEMAGFLFPELINKWKGLKDKVSPYLKLKLRTSFTGVWNLLVHYLYKHLLTCDEGKLSALKQSYCQFERQFEDIEAGQSLTRKKLKIMNFFLEKKLDFGLMTLKSKLSLVKAAMARRAEDQVLLVRGCELEMLLHQLSGHRVRANYFDEIGIDQGGIYREALGVIGSKFSLSHLPTNDERETALLAKLIVDCLANNYVVNLRLDLALLRYLLDQPCRPQDLYDLDPQLYQHLCSLRLIQDVEQLGLTFQAANSQQVFELVEGGGGLGVTRDNLEEYIAKYAEFKLVRSRINFLRTLKHMVQLMIEPRLLKLFSPEEVRLLMTGGDRVDLAQLRAHTKYEKIKEGDKLIVWFWEILEDFTQEQLRRLVQFVTGSAAVPALGFSYQFGLVVSYEEQTGENLPESHTCVNTLDIDNYVSKETMRSKLLLALQEGHEGFNRA